MTVAVGRAVDVSRLLKVAAAVLVATTAAVAEGAEYRATPDSYANDVARLQPGDHLRLESGIYRAGLSLRNLHGLPSQPIVIEGPVEGAPATFVGRKDRNTISLRHTSHVVIRNLVLDGAGLEVDAIKAERAGGLVHHITLENLTIIGHDVDQGIIAISTKTPAAFWTIRNNLIVGAGTGMYLGNSDGDAPFVAGLIEGNIIADTRGYNVQIKQQRPRPALDGLPESPQKTVIRGNYFSKSRNASIEELARPNLLLGHFPLEGPGREDEYVVTGNVFFANPVESLLQAEGNVGIIGNAFVNPAGNAISLQPHKDVPRRMEVSGNFIVASGYGVRLQGAHPGFRQAISGNLDFSAGSQTRSDPAARFREWVRARADARGIADTGRDPLAAALALACGRHGKAGQEAGFSPVPADHFLCQPW